MENEYREAQIEAASLLGDEIKAALLAYVKTGEIADVLLPGFDQRGRWSEQSPISLDSGEAEDRLRSVVLPVSRRSTVNPDGERILLTSYILKRPTKKPCHEIPWHEIRGLIHIESKKEVIAPNLRRIASRYKAYIIGPSLILPELRTATSVWFIVEKLTIPSLETVGEASFSTSNLTAPSLRTAVLLEIQYVVTAQLPVLQTVDLGIFGLCVLNFHAPNLETVNSKGNWPFCIAFSFATSFYAPKLRTNGRCAVNPYVRERMAAAIIKRSSEEIEI